MIVADALYLLRNTSQLPSGNNDNKTQIRLINVLYLRSEVKYDLEIQNVFLFFVLSNKMLTSLGLSDIFINSLLRINLYP